MSRGVILMKSCLIKQVHGENRRKQEAKEERNTSVIIEKNILKIQNRTGEMLRNGGKRTLKKFKLNEKHNVQSKSQVVKSAKIAIRQLVHVGITQTTLNLSPSSLFVANVMDNLNRGE